MSTEVGTSAAELSRSISEGSSSNLDVGVSPATLASLNVSWEAALRPLTAEEEASFQVPLAIFVGAYTAIGGLALGGGVIAGMRSFEGSEAYEELAKLEKPKPGAEAQAMRMAVRAFGLGTALCFGSAGAAVLAARHLFGVHTAADFGESVARSLRPHHLWMMSTASRANEAGLRLNGALEGGLVRARQWWRGGGASEGGADV